MTEHYKLMMNEDQFRERVSRMWTDVRFKTQQNPRVFFEDQSFVLKPQESDAQFLLKGEYQNLKDYLDLRIIYPESPQRQINLITKFQKILALILLSFMGISLFLFFVIAYLSLGVPVLTMVILLVLMNIFLSILKNFNGKPDNVLFEKRFRALFDREEIIRVP